jgi:hypothetical protein
MPHSYGCSTLNPEPRTLNPGPIALSTQSQALLAGPPRLQALAGSGLFEASNVGEVLARCESELPEVRRVAVETLAALAKGNAGHAPAVEKVCSLLVVPRLCAVASVRSRHRSAHLHIPNTNTNNTNDSRSSKSSSSSSSNVTCGGGNRDTGGAAAQLVALVRFEKDWQVQAAACRALGVVAERHDKRVLGVLSDKVHRPRSSCRFALPRTSSAISTQQIFDGGQTHTRKTTASGSFCLLSDASD